MRALSRFVLFMFLGSMVSSMGDEVPMQKAETTKPFGSISHHAKPYSGNTTVVMELENALGDVMSQARMMQIQHGMPPDAPASEVAAAPPQSVLAHDNEAPAKATLDELKQQVGYRAVDDNVKSGMTIGLGTGSTARYAVERVGELLKKGKLENIRAVPTSLATEEQATHWNIPLVTLDDLNVSTSGYDLDVAIDGADSVDKTTLDLVKGGGGAHLREKMVEIRAKKFVVIVDSSKITDGLGPHFKVPVEVTPFCVEHVGQMIMQLPAFKDIIEDWELRVKPAKNHKIAAEPIKTDNANYIIDLKFKSVIPDLVAAADELSTTVGVVEHGLFVGMSSEVLVADAEKGVYSLKPPSDAEESVEQPASSTGAALLSYAS